MALTFTPTNNAPPRKPAEKQGTTYRSQTVFNKTIELDELSINSEKTKTTTRKSENVTSISYPLVKINQYMFTQAELRSVVIDCTEFLPKIIVVRNSD